MSRRFFAVLSLVLVSVSLSACSDVTAPTSQRQVGASGPSTVTTCTGGSLESSGKC